MININEQLNYLGNPQFLEDLYKANLNEFVFNRLFCAHVITIALQTTTIKEGDVYFSYVFSTANHFEKDVLGPKFLYSFYNNRDALIEPDNRCTASNARIANKNFSFRTARELRDFLNEYAILHMKHLPGVDRSNQEIKDVKLSYKKPKDKKNLINDMYQKIILNNHELLNYLSFFYLNKELANQPTTKKIKL